LKWPTITIGYVAWEHAYDQIYVFDDKLISRKLTGYDSVELPRGQLLFDFHIEATGNFIEDRI